MLQHVRWASQRLMWHWVPVPCSSFANVWTSEADDSELSEGPKPVTRRTGLREVNRSSSVVTHFIGAS